MRNDNPKYKDNLIVNLTFEFSIDIVEFCEMLEEKRKYSIARQLLKSGTSIGANVREAQNAESKNDFIHKIKIAAKEADETMYWLLICERAKNYENPDKLFDKLESINKVLNSIISTSKNINKISSTN